MTTDAVQDHPETPQSRCWCCGAQESDSDLVHLGNHPEVGICIRCAGWVRRRARELEDRHSHGIPARLRGLVRGARATVMAKGWHERGPLGALLRRIDRYLP